MSLFDISFDPLAPREKRAKQPKAAAAKRSSQTVKTPALRSEAERTGTRQSAPTQRETPVARGIILREQRCRACNTVHKFVDGDFIIYSNGRKDATRIWRQHAESLASLRALPREFYSCPEETVDECFECLMSAQLAGTEPAASQHLEHLCQMALVFPETSEPITSPTLVDLLHELQDDFRASGETTF